ncbi:hypothetical protein I3843_08G097900 [Carya illinoinensis]|uniref:Transmembrane protein n=1 Tax=Carya illinoinensis TaxID=32201 RepID=A0A922JAZ7_CARIL|nr:hypothetical protein I3842_08G101600 [Carya illinoinensis]KAG7967404.1 hypothetical protein I3843_08G097900 [Carya illinoinensis]
MPLSSMLGSPLFVVSWCSHYFESKLVKLSLDFHFSFPKSVGSCLVFLALCHALFPPPAVSLQAPFPLLFSFSILVIYFVVCLFLVLAVTATTSGPSPPPKLHLAVVVNLPPPLTIVGKRRIKSNRT